mgnify:CR=1 FL=1
MSTLKVNKLQKTVSGASTFTLPTADGTVGQLMKTDGAGQLGWATDSAGMFSSYAVIADQKSAGTDGGTFTSGAWQTRDLQTEIADPDGIVSIAANAFTLAAGSYLIKWSCSAFTVNSHKARLYDVTGTASVGMGMPEWSGSSSITNSSVGSARVSPSASNVYRIEHRCSLTHSSQGFGVSANFSEPEIYTLVEIFKEAS